MTIKSAGNLRQQPVSKNKNENVSTTQRQWVPEQLRLPDSKLREISYDYALVVGIGWHRRLPVELENENQILGGTNFSKWRIPQWIFHQVEEGNTSSVRESKPSCEGVPPFILLVSILSSLYADLRWQALWETGTETIWEWNVSGFQCVPAEPFFLLQNAG